MTDTRTMREEYKTAKQLVALDKKGIFIYGLQAYNGKVFDITPYSKIDFPTYNEALEYREYNRDIELYDAGGRYYGFVRNNAFYHRYHFICRQGINKGQEEVLQSFRVWQERQCRKGSMCS